MSNLQVTPITGLSQINGWANVVIHPSKTLVCVLSVAGKNANSVGKTISEHIAHFSLTTSAQLHNSLLHLMQTAREENCRLQFACLAWSENKAVLATSEGTVFLKRNHRIGEILSSEGELKIIEGARMPGDVFVLSTHQAANNFPELKNVLHQNTESLVPQLVTELHAREASALSAMAWVEDGPKEEITSPAAVAATETYSTEKKAGATAAFGGLANLKNRIPARWRRNPLPALRNLGGRLKNTVSSIGQRDASALSESKKPGIKIFLIGAGALIVILLTAILWKRFQINQEVQAVQPRFGELQTQLTQAQSLGPDQAIEARAQVRDVMRGFEDLIAANPDKPQAIKVIKEEYERAQAFANTISGTETQGALEPFFDLRLAEASFVAKDLAAATDTLVALDASGERLVVLNTQTKQTSQFPLENIGSARTITTSENEAVILSDGLHAYALDDEHSHTQLKAAGDSDRNGTHLGSFTSYLYVLNPQARNIYRYLRNDDSLSDPVGWLVDKQGLEFTSIESMTIDGDLWLSTNSGQIFKYTQGRRQDFTIGQMPTPFDSALQLATRPESDYLFVLEKNRRRLVVLQKDGTFVKEIVSDSLASADTLAADSTENAAYVVSGSLVYKISL